jgi:hypothetical protein
MQGYCPKDTPQSSNVRLAKECLWWLVTSYTLNVSSNVKSVTVIPLRRLLTQNSIARHHLDAIPPVGGPHRRFARTLCRIKQVMTFEAAAVFEEVP